MSKKTVIIRDGVWKKLRRRLSTRSYVKVGVLASKGGAEARDGVTMIELAAIHEFGTRHVPARPFLRTTFVKKEKQVAKMAAKLARAIVVRNLPVDQALDMLGSWAAAQVKNYVTQGPHLKPKLKPATIRRKGSTRPLVDTGRLINSVSWEVGS